MSDWYHLTDKATGDMQIVASLNGYEVDLFDVVELEREPSEFDDVVDGRLVHNPARQADTQAGPEHIAEARVQKRIEALLIASGITLTGGLLNAEATARGMDVADLATDVIVKAADFIEAEIARQAPDIEAKNLAGETKP